MNREFFQAEVVSVLQCGGTSRTLIKSFENKVDGNYTRMLRPFLTNPENDNPQNRRSTSTNLPSHKLYR